MSAAPDKVPRLTRSLMAANSFSVAASSWVRLRARWAANSGVAARDQPFAGVVGMGDLGQILLVEQAHLQWAVIGRECGDGGVAQRGDPPETLRFPRHR